MQELLWMLLPIAAASGWYAARHSKGKAADGADAMLSPEYFKGLNYLLNEQPDKAIDVFVRMLEVNSDTVETHLALGNLFRKRGEVDRAIRIHQNLIARQTLNPEQRMEALLELGKDYMRAGLLDRAEGLFQELIQNNAYESSVLPLLLDLYQQEKDWESAIAIAKRMRVAANQPAGKLVAQFYCEMAEAAHVSGNTDEALVLLARAMQENPLCARASLLRGNMARQNGDCKTALNAYRQVVDQDIELLPEILEPMHACHTAQGTLGEMIEYLQQAITRYAGISPVLALADILSEEKGSQQAAEFIAGELARRPSVRGLSRFIQLNLSESDGVARENLLILKNLTDQLLEDRPIYKCRDCGFCGKVLHWQCPGCKHWNTVKPIHGVEGE